LPRKDTAEINSAGPSDPDTPLAAQEAALAGSQPTPHAIPLAGLNRIGKAFLPHRTCPTDCLGGADLGRFCLVGRKEQIVSTTRTGSEFTPF